MAWWRFGAGIHGDPAYEQITAELQDALSELSGERTLPVVG